MRLCLIAAAAGLLFASPALADGESNCGISGYIVQSVQAKLATQGVEPMPLSPQEFDAVIAKEIVSNIKLAKAAGLKFN